MTLDKKTEFIFNNYLTRHDLSSLVSLWNSIPKFVKEFLEQEILTILPLNVIETKYFKDENEKTLFKRRIINLITMRGEEFVKKLMKVDIKMCSSVLKVDREEFSHFYLKDDYQAQNNIANTLMSLSLLYESITSFISNNKIVIVFNDSKILPALSDTLTESIDPFETPLPFEDFYISFVDSKLIYRSHSDEDNINLLYTGLHFSRNNEEITLTYYVVEEDFAEHLIFPIIKSYKFYKGNTLDFSEFKKERSLDTKTNSKEFLFNWALSVGIYLSTIDLENKKIITTNTPKDKVEKVKRLPKKTRAEKSLNDHDYTLSYIVNSNNSISLVENKSSGESQYPLAIVRGYWRWQKYGEGLKYKKLIHIKPFLKGNPNIKREGNRSYLV